MKKLLLILLCLPLFFTTCKEEDENEYTPNSLPNINVIIEKEWWVTTANGVNVNNISNGFFLDSDEKYYVLKECVQTQIGNWEIEKKGYSVSDTILLKYQYMDTLYEFGAPYLQEMTEILGRITKFSSTSLTLYNDINSAEYIFTQEYYPERCTYVPNDNFEQKLIDLGYDDAMDNYVQTSNIDTITNLDVDGESISDLTGIEDFINLTTLKCGDNLLNTLDVSNNYSLTHLWCYDNQLTSLDLSNNISYLDCSSNQITTLDLSNKTALTTLRCGGSNQLTFLDLNETIKDLYIGASSLTTIDLNLDSLSYIVIQGGNFSEIYLNGYIPLVSVEINGCHQLTYLDFWNGHGPYIGLSSMQIYDTPNLTCVKVDSPSWWTSNWTAFCDPQIVFSNNCP